MISFYRKYRPQKVDELDLSLVREYFGQVLESGKFSQAYLFSGPKGTGKTSTARILAKILNCEKNELQSSKVARSQGGKVAKLQSLKEPCGKCSSCKAIVGGARTAVVEIDGASNRGIDDIRILRERVGLVPGDGAYAVYIIDEVHMLTREAFNALLKTLEEPPVHVVFCLCTTEEHKVPDTIVSRCTKVPFSRASDVEVIRSLKRVVRREKLQGKVSDQVLDLIAGGADGSFRDAVKVLEQLVTKKGKISLDDVLSVVGQSQGNAVSKLMSLLVSNEVKNALGLVDEVEKSGADMKLFAKSVLQEARGRMVEEIEDDQIRVEMVRLIEVFGKSFSRFADVPIEALPIEMAVVEFCLGGQKSDVKISSSVSNPKNVTADGSKDKKKVEKRELENEVEEAIVGDKKINGEASESKVKVDDGLMEISLEIAQSKWREILAKVSEQNHGLELLLRRSQLMGCDGGKLEVAVFYKFHKEQLEQDRYLVLVESAARSVLEGNVKFEYKLMNEADVPQALQEHENISGVIEKGDEEVAKAAEEIFG